MTDRLVLHSPSALVDQQLTRARRVHFHRGSPELDGLDTVKFAEPLCRVRDALHPAHFRSAGYVLVGEGGLRS
jgi:hypothetical protein